MKQQFTYVKFAILHRHIISDVTMNAHLPKGEGEINNLGYSR